MIRISEDLSALSVVAMDMRRRGVIWSTAAREVHRGNLSAAITTLRDTWGGKFVGYELGANGAHPSLKRLFFDEWKLNPLRFSKITQKPKLDTWSLQMYRAKGGEVAAAASLILEFRKNTKLLTTYIEGVVPEEDGRVHPSWSVWAPITGRWACSSPNLMNLPKEKKFDLGGAKKYVRPGMRDMIVAAPGNIFVAADYAKLELWIVAAFAGDEVLIKAWQDNDDVHTQNANDMLHRVPTKDERDFVKRFVYGANYDAQPETLWETMVTEFPATQLSHVRRLLIAWRAKHPRIFKMHERWRREAMEKKYVEIPGIGKRVYYPDDKQVVNIPVQGTGAVLANRAVREIAKRGRAQWLVIQCHDELVLEVPKACVPEAAQLLKETMELPLMLNGKTWVFPVELKAGYNWGAMQELSHMSC